jgi:hypothetical protein
MFIHSAAWLKDRVVYLSRLRATLAVVIGKIDEELIPLKEAQNAPLSPMSRLPDDVLVRVLRFSQDWGGVEGLHSVSVVPHLDWWRIMSVSTHFRKVILSSPTLWAALSSRWPRTWNMLCAKRAEDCLLRLFIDIASVSKVKAACHLLSRSKEAAIQFSPDKTTPGWNETYLHVLKASYPGLLSLKVEENYELPSLTLAPPLLTLCTALSNLDIMRSVVEDTFSFPPSLRRLCITGLHISTSTDRLRRLFAGLPLLEEFEIHGTEDMHNSSVTIIDSLEPVIEPLVLLALSSLRLYLDTAPMHLAHAISQVLDIPKRVLEISVTADAGASASSAQQAAAELMMTRNLVEYTQRFWTRAARSSQLPSATLFDHGTDGCGTSHHYRVEIQGGDPEDAAGVSLCFHVTSELHPPSDVFLPLVTHFEVMANTNEAHRFNDWPPPGSLPALETMCIELWDAWRAVDEIQRWVDKHAQQHPIVVQFEADDDDLWPSLQWRTDCGPLKDINWSAFITKVATCTPLPNEHEGWREDSVLEEEDTY